jgi:superfamily II helicase
MAATNLFTSAKTIAAKPTAGKKAAKVTTLIEGLEIYAAIDHSVKWLTTIGKTIKADIIDVVTEKFIRDGIAKRGAPVNFDGSEGAAVASIQLRKRSSASGLNDIEIEMAAKYNVPTETVSDRPETFIINTDHLDWLLKNSAKLSAVLNKFGAPPDLFQKQEATTKVVTTDDSIDHVFRNFHDQPSVIAALLPVVTVISVGPKFKAEDEEDLNNQGALALLKSYIAGED